MKEPKFIDFGKTTTFKGNNVNLPDSPSVFDRQERIKGFDQNKLSNARIILVGAGGFGSELGEGLIRKGVKDISLFDMDFVEATNLNRQKFYPKDIHKNKALCLAENLCSESTNGALIHAFPFEIEEHIEKNTLPKADLFVVGVDSYSTRFEVSKYLLRVRKPGVILGASEDAEFGYVFVQEPKGPCFACIYPPLKGKKREDVESDRKKCDPAAAVKDILKALSGIAIFAVDTLLMNRKRNWNFWEIHLSGFFPDRKMDHKIRPGCALCSGVRLE